MKILKVLNELISANGSLYTIEEHTKYLEKKIGKDKRTIRRWLKDMIASEKELNEFGIGIKKKEKNGRTYYSFIKDDSKEKILELDSRLSNALTDSLDIAAVSSSFHYKKDIADLKYWLKNNINFESEDFEIYVGHNNRGDEVDWFNTNEKLNMIKKTIKNNGKLKFSIRFDEENFIMPGDKKEKWEGKRLLKSLSGNGGNKSYEMFPVFIIHDSDETFILFKNFDTKTKKVANHYVNIDNLIHEENIKLEFVKDLNKEYAQFEIMKNEFVGKYTFKNRKSVQIKIKSDFNYFLTRHAQYSIEKYFRKDETETIILNFSEVYHALNFVFMNGGLKKVIDGYEDDPVNENINKYWRKKVEHIKSIN